MIQYLNIPGQAQINTPISKTLFLDKGDLSAIEKRVLREDVGSITMKGLFQTRTIGLADYVDNEYQYDQLVVAEVAIANVAKAEVVAHMIQKNFPVPMILIIHVDNRFFSINWCTKRINQADRTKRVIEDMQQTRIFTTDLSDAIAIEWLETLDITKLKCETIKDLFDRLSEKLLMLKVSDEAGVFVGNTTLSIDEYRRLFEQLKANRDEQKKLMQDLKKETQFNNQMKLNLKLKELQVTEIEIKSKMK